MKPIHPGSRRTTWPDRLKGLEEVEDCYSVAGDENYILNVRVGDAVGQLESPAARGSVRPRSVSTRTTVVLSTPFEARTGGDPGLSEGSSGRRRHETLSP